MHIIFSMLECKIIFLFLIYSYQILNCCCQIYFNFTIFYILTFTLRKKNNEFKNKAKWAENRKRKLELETNLQTLSKIFNFFSKTETNGKQFLHLSKKIIFL